MAIATTLEHCLEQQQIHFDVINHARTYSSMETARTCHISADHIAKAVIFVDENADENHYLMAVVPASCQVSINHLNDLTHYHLSLAAEKEGQKIFSDCELGAYPPIGKAYGMETVVDDALLQHDDIYFEAGDHTEIIHLSGKNFQNLLGDHFKHGQIGRERSNPATYH